MTRYEPSVRPDRNVRRLSGQKTGVKLFGIGFHKTGTSSLHHWCIASGLSSRHWPVAEGGRDLEAACAAYASQPDKVVDCLAPLIGSYDAHSDVPYPGLYAQLSARYPEAYFVLTRRDLDAWWDSLVEHWALWAWPRRLETFEHIQYRPYLKNPTMPLRRRDGALMKAAHAAHVAAVEQHFEGNPRFVSFDISDPDKALMLARLTGRDPVAFPRSNPRPSRCERLRQRLHDATGRSRRALLRASLRDGAPS